MKSVITGASGAIGGAIARAFAQRGDHLALLYHSNEDSVNALAREVAAQGAMVVVKKIDLADAEGTEIVLDALAKEFGAPDVLVNAAGISVVALGKLFRTSMQTTPGKYITSLRLEKARHLLEFSELPVAQIAEQCGFSTGSYFSKVFRTHLGGTPLEYRLKRRGKPSVS